MKNINPVRISSATATGKPISYRESLNHHYRGYQERKQRRPYQPISEPLLNLVQQRIYDEALYGLKTFTPEELAKMPKDRKHHIISRFNKVQLVLNRLKQETANEFVDRILLAFFPKSAVVQTFTRVKGHDNKIKSFHTFKELGINQLVIAKKLCQEGLLPRNFFELQVKTQ